MDRKEILGLKGATVTDPTGDKIGTIDEIYLDDDTGEPEWATVHTGVGAVGYSFVPLAGVQLRGNDVCVSYPKAKVAQAPGIDPGAHVSQQQEAQLYDYYSLPYSESRSESGLPSKPQQSGSDDAMTRSEEELEVRKQQRPREKVRLRKHVVTENVETTIPVEREEVRVEREPITEGNVDQALSGPEISESEHEVTLNEEQVVTEKKAVPKERVGLKKDAATEEQAVSEELRKEEIDIQKEPLR